MPGSFKTKPQSLSVRENENEKKKKKKKKKKNFFIKSKVPVIDIFGTAGSALLS